MLGSSWESDAACLSFFFGVFIVSGLAAEFVSTLRGLLKDSMYHSACACETVHDPCP